MKDAQTDLSGQQAYIPVISPMLHVLAMPALVFLRSSFGYLYLRPKSIFCALSLASALLFIVGLNETALWTFFAAPITMALATTCLYMLHLLIALTAQLRQGGEPDTYSGKSHLLRILPASDRLEMHLHIWGEPLLLTIAGIVARVSAASPLLSYWLHLTAATLFLKELRTYWAELRKRKRRTDLQAETEEEASQQSSDAVPAPLKGVRKPRRQHNRVDSQE